MNLKEEVNTKKLIMETFKIEIKETLSNIIEIQAENEQQAIDIIKKKYNNEEIILDSNNYIDTEISNYK